MAVLFEHRLTIAGFETRALEVEGDGPPVLFLHGWSDSADTWRPVLDRLRRRGRAAVALDLPGYGTATHLDTEEPILAQLDRFTRAAVIRFAGDGRVILAGNSLGGCAALRAAEVPGLPIAGVMPIAPAGLDMAGWFLVVEGERLIRLLLASPIPVPAPLVRQVVGTVYRQLAFARPFAADPRYVTSFSSHVSTRADVARILASGRRLRGELRDPFRFERVECPVLVVWGDSDRMVFSSGASRLLAGVRDARLEVIEGCGHCPQLEEPDRVVELVDSFATDVAGTAEVA
ncbi:MAG TPA: alpha/beta fold hydrolase [Solirubrobacterales bacterium]|nr:alpha/beta fold hydrolase [Solirubrobacterales bacterium]